MKGTKQIKKPTKHQILQNTENQFNGLWNSVNDLLKKVGKIENAVFGNISKENPNGGIGLIRAYDDLDIRSLAIYRVLKEQNILSEEKFLKHFADIKKEIVIAQEDAMYRKLGFEKKDEKSVAENGDLVIIDLSGTVDGKGFPGDKQKNVHIIIGRKQPFEGFDTNLIGAEIGKDIEFTVTPPKDYPIEEIQEKLVHYKAKILSIRKPIKKENALNVEKEKAESAKKSECQEEIS